MHTASGLNFTIIYYFRSGTLWSYLRLIEYIHIKDHITDLLLRPDCVPSDRYIHVTFSFAYTLPLVFA